MPETLFDEAPVININGKRYVPADEISKRFKTGESEKSRQWPGYMNKKRIAEYMSVSLGTLYKIDFFKLLDGFKLGERTTIYSKKSVDRALRKYQLLGGE